MPDLAAAAPGSNEAAVVSPSESGTAMMVRSVDASGRALGSRSVRSLTMTTWAERGAGASEWGVLEMKVTREAPKLLHSMHG